MIARIWQGWTPSAAADAYQRHYETEVSDHLQRLAGFRGGRLLRRQHGDEVAFTSITFFASMDAVRAFAGTNPDIAVVADTARRVLSRWDHHVTHHEVAVDIIQP
jgi:heme-degrading monooxygenase HmoA